MEKYVQESEEQNIAETEVKVELKETDVPLLEERLQELGFVAQEKTEILKDIFVSRVASLYGGWDFERLRSIDDEQFVVTKKAWTPDKDGNRIRLEDEHDIAAEDFHALEASGKTVIRKERQNYHGNIDGRATTVSLDRLQIAQQLYLFLEVEMLTNVEESAMMRAYIHQWINDTLFGKEMKEAPTIMEFLESLKVEL
jgi:hypothetical protein